jgi:hypothetical protein
MLDRAVQLQQADQLAVGGQRCALRSHQGHAGPGQRLVQGLDTVLQHLLARCERRRRMSAHTFSRQAKSAVIASSPAIANKNINRWIWVCLNMNERPPCKCPKTAAY